MLAGFPALELWQELGLSALVIIYHARFHATSRMATVGKMLVGFKVVRLDGRRISFLRASVVISSFWAAL